MKQYFRELMQDHDNTVLKSVLIDLLDCRKSVVRDVRAGRVQVNQQQTNIEQMLYQHRILEKESEQKSKRLLLQKQIQNLNRSDYENDEAYKKAKQQIIMQRQQQILQQKQQKDRRKKEIEQKVKKWSQQQKQLLKKKEQKAKEQQKLKQMQEKAERIKKQSQKKAAAIEKRKLIQQSLKNIEQNRMKRQDMIRSLRSQSQEKIPLFKEIQKRNQMLNDQREFEENQAKRKYKIQMKIDYEDIKKHQRMFLTKIQQRNKRFEESRARAASSMPDCEFNIYTNRSQQKVKEQLLKKNRRWKYQQKIKQIPIQIDQAKKVKIQIALDKSKNPFKYNFLSQKSLNEFQIYGQFKNFSINSNPRQIGKNYLEELKKIPKQSRIQKSSSVQFIKQSSISDRPQYRNYLAELKSKRPQTKQEQKDEIKKIISKSKNKDEAYKSLQKKSDELESNVQQKMKELKSLNSKNIKNILKKQSEIDEVYAKALKARLACLEIVS